jgi:two-component system, chemotaxis family, chemotaxis protein CheY
VEDVNRVLIVEDNEDLRALLGDVLDDAGFDVLIVSNGAEALEATRQWRPAAIVLDLMMPVMDGAAFLRERRLVPALASVPVLVLTAHPYHHRVLDGLGPTAVLRKPYDLDELISAVQALCQGETGRGQAC